MSDAAAPGVRIVPLHDAAARAAYADLAAASPQRTPFAGLAFADAACAALGYTGRLALDMTDDGTAQIGAVLFEENRRLVVPVLAPHTGPLFRTDVGLNDAARIGAFLRAVTAGMRSAAFSLAPEITDVRPFTWAGFTATLRYTYRGAAGLAGAPPYVRKMVRENGPVRADGSVRETGTATAFEPDAARDVVAAMERAMGRAGRPMPVPAERAARLLRALVTAGVARIAVADTQGRRVGAVATLAGDRSGHFWIGAGDPGPSMLLMMAATTASLAADGIREFDLVGANLARVSVFKQRFGLPLVPYVHVAWTGSRALRLRDAARLALRPPAREVL